MKVFILIVSVLVFTSGCSINNSEYEYKKLQEENKKLTKENESLKKDKERLEVQVDELVNGAPELLKKIQIAYNTTNYNEVKVIFNRMDYKYKYSKEYTNAKVVFDKVLKYEETEKQKRLASLNKLKKDVDTVSGTTWYENPYFKHYNNRNYVSLYFGDEKSSIFLRLKMSYYGEDWLFFEKAYLSYDGNTIEIPFDEYKDKKSDNDTKVWEWLDVSVTSDILVYLRDFAKSKDAKVRFSGKYSQTRTLSENERQGLIDVINGYDVLLNEKK